MGFWIVGLFSGVGKGRGGGGVLFWWVDIHIPSPLTLNLRYSVPHFFVPSGILRTPNPPIIFPCFPQLSPSPPPPLLCYFPQEKRKPRFSVNLALLFPILLLSLIPAEYLSPGSLSTRSLVLAARVKRDDAVGLRIR